LLIKILIPVTNISTGDTYVTMSCYLTICILYILQIAMCWTAYTQAKSTNCEFDDVISIDVTSSDLKRRHQTVSKDHLKLIGPLKHAIFPVPLVFDAYNFTQLPLQPSSADLWLKPH